MADTVTRNLRVNWTTSRIEFANNTNDLERFFFEVSDGNQSSRQRQVGKRVGHGHVMTPNE
jgi:hypothetical protein